jgi:ABC-type bacteriocin/lantibiotic exporter with double-glycine peptidase domain
MTIGQLIALNMLLSMFQQPLNQLTSLWQEFLQTKIAIERLSSILKKMYNSALQGEKVTQIYLFAISYAKEIQRNNYRIAEIIRFSLVK